MYQFSWDCKIEGTGACTNLVGDCKIEDAKGRGQAKLFVA